MQESPPTAEVTANLERGTIAFSSDEPGEYIFLYDLAAGENVSVGLVRVQVIERPDDAPGPIAVKDTAFLRPGEPVSVPLLANDVSPSGRVLAVQSIDDTLTEGLASVELLTNTVARVSASEALDRQLQFEYTVSDGVKTSTATVTVVPVPPLVKHQPPVALDDTAIVRAGDIVTVPVLDNDYHPDAATLHLSSELDVTGVDGGLAFVDGEEVRFQAPDNAGTQTIVYTVEDDFEQLARARLTLTVVGRDAENRPPQPAPLTSRTFESSSVKIEVPLDGIDPDGDSVRVRSMTEPTLGRITERTSTSFTYEAFGGSSGTDVFDYEVEDALGATAKGAISIGVIPRPATQAPPNAVDDVVEMKPGRTVGVEVLLNDSDPSGYSLSVADLPEIPDGIEAEIRDRRRVVVTAPDGEGAYTLRYEITNGHGGTDSAFVQIAVSEDAVVPPPTVEDQVIEPEQVVTGERVVVDPYSGATNPGGLVEDLVVSTHGPNSDRAEIAADGTISVQPGRERYAVAFRLTNELDELSAMAFVIVPPVPDPEGEEDEELAPEETQQPKTEEELQAEERAKFPAPHLKDLAEIIVPMNGSIEWTVDELVEVPSGQPATILSATASEARTDPFVSGTELQFQPETDYRGPATLTFEVTDGTSADDPVGRKAVLTLPITVGDPEFNDVPPTFTPRSETIEAGEAARELDLRQMTDQPNPDNIERVTYTNLDGTTSDIAAELVDGATLRFSAPLGVQPGTSTRLTFDVSFNEFTVPGYVDVKVVSSTRAEPRAVNDPNTGEYEMTRGESLDIDVLENDFNPFAQDDVPLRVIGAEIDQQSVGSGASVSFTATGITVTTGSAFTGNLSIVYRIEDGTKDPARNAQGRVSVVVRDKPDAPGRPEIVSSGDRTVTIRWAAPANNNAQIDRYQVQSAPGSGTREFSASDAGANQAIGGLTNGTAYTFQVRAHNEKGWGAWSTASASRTPYGTPSPPRDPKANAAGYASTTVNVSWTAPSNTGGGGVRYQARIGGGNWKDVSGTSTSFGGIGQGTHRVDVRAINLGGGGISDIASTNVSVQNPPPPVPSGTITKGPSRSCDSGGSGCANVRITWKNMDPGRYRVYALAGGSSCCSYQQEMDVSASGRVELSNHLGRRSDTIAVRFENVSGGTSVTLGAISGATWNGLPFNQW